MASLEQRVSIYTEIPIVPKQKDIFVVAYTAAPMIDRVSYGFRRAKTLQSESGFSVIANKDTIIYSALDMGGREPLTTVEQNMGITCSTNVGLESLDQIAIDKVDARPETHPFMLLGTFHFHPPASNWIGFSTEDVILNANRGDNVSSIELRPDYTNGVFITRRDRDKTQSRLLLVHGPVYDSAYLEEDFNALYSVENQIPVLEESGFRVVFADIPVKRNVADLSQLRVALEHRNESE